LHVLLGSHTAAVGEQKREGLAGPALLPMHHREVLLQGGVVGTEPAERGAARPTGQD
jgi:hypothetical protein